MFKLLKLFKALFFVENEILIAALIYIDRILESNDSLVIDDINGRGFLLTSLVLATKFYYDKYEKGTMFRILIGESY